MMEEAQANEEGGGLWPDEVASEGDGIYGGPRQRRQRRRTTQETVEED
jgi:hypothetical protein